MNIYSGTNGTVERIPEPEFTRPLSGGTEQPSPERDYTGAGKRPSSQTGLLKGLGGLFSKFMDSKPQIEDLLLIGILYLLYRESGDIEFLLIAGAMLFT